MIHMILNKRWASIVVNINLLMPISQLPVFVVRSYTESLDKVRHYFLCVSHISCLTGIRLVRRRKSDTYKSSSMFRISFLHWLPLCLRLPKIKRRWNKSYGSLFLKNYENCVFVYMVQGTFSANDSEVSRLLFCLFYSFFSLVDTSMGQKRSWTQEHTGGTNWGLPIILFLFIRTWLPLWTIMTFWRLALHSL